ncbi:hypothetical protein HDU98_009661 [Podochytrium sp. JEL0797]|nr:hypothetical protein HDU98_009661 [Podochytrium sp. JEL0797]
MSGFNGNIRILNDPASQRRQGQCNNVIPGVVYSTAIVKAKSLPAVPTANNGIALDIQCNGSNVLNDGKGNKGPATVVLADRVVVHVIDTVMLPPLGGFAATTAAGIVALRI